MFVMTIPATTHKVVAPLAHISIMDKLKSPQLPIIRDLQKQNMDRRNNRMCQSLTHGEVKKTVFSLNNNNYNPFKAGDFYLEKSLREHQEYKER
jgi:hypothetical protein